MGILKAGNPKILNRKCRYSTAHAHAQSQEEVQAAPENRMDRVNRMLGRDNSYKVAPAPDPSARNAGGGAPTFDVRLPPNARPGVTIMARAPNGRNVRLTVPHGVPPGGTITVRY